MALAVGISVTPAYAIDEHNTVPNLTAVGAPLGLHGVDPVAFIQLGNHIEGTAQHAAIYDGVAYYFGSEASLNTFKKMSARYVPQNGGYCTFGVSANKKFDGNLRYAAVLDEKFYVFLNEDILKAYQTDPKGTISKIKKNWEEIEHKAAKSL